MTERWGYRPQVKPFQGFVGSTVRFRRKGEYVPTGRRIIPKKEVSKLWLEGLTVRQIADALGWFKGTKFRPASIVAVIDRERRFGDPKLFPIRRSADDGEPDFGIDEQTAARLGL